MQKSCPRKLKESRKMKMKFRRLRKGVGKKRWMTYQLKCDDHLYLTYARLYFPLLMPHTLSKHRILEET